MFLAFVVGVVAGVVAAYLLSPQTERLETLPFIGWVLVGAGLPVVAGQLAFLALNQGEGAGVFAFWLLSAGLGAGIGWAVNAIRLRLT